MCVQCGQDARHELCLCEDPERPLVTILPGVGTDNGDSDPNDMRTAHDLL
ncbi:MAG: hypothetical protein AAB562_01005 [Patescibacteria group bacterium]